MSTVIPSVSGTSMSQFVAALREIYGPDWVTAGLERLAEEERLQIVQAASFQWIPLETLRRSVDAWAEVSGIDANEITRRGVQLSVKRSFATVWRLLLSVTTDAGIIARAPLLWSKTRNVGQLVASLRAPKQGRAVLTEFKSPTDRQMFSVAVAIETYIELTGRKNARCKFRRTSDGAIFDITWGDEPAT